MATTKATNESHSMLNSKQLLQQSIACINDGMEMENNDQLESALMVYEQGLALLTQANAVETNRDVLPVISANLASIEQRVLSLRDKLQFNTMVTDLRRMHQQSMDLFMQYDALSDQRKDVQMDYEQRVNAESIASNDDEEDVDTICNEDGSQITDADQLMNALYQQYYGANVAAVSTAAASDEAYMDGDADATPRSPQLDTTDDGDRDTMVTVSPSSTSSSLKHIAIAHDIDFTVYHELDTFTTNGKKFGDALITGITNDICAYIFEFISGRQLTRLFMISKYWCYCLLYDAVFSHLWKRVIIGADPLRHSLGHNLHLRWVSTQICGTVIRAHAETLIISVAGLALDVLLTKPNRDDLCILRQCKFPRLKSLVMYGWSNVSVMALKMVLKHNLSHLRELYLETPIDVLDVCPNLPSLRVLQCNVITAHNLQLRQEHKFPALVYLSFVYGVDDFVLNRLFFSFPNLKHIGLEFDEMSTSLRKLLLYKRTALDVLHMSWNAETFWGVHRKKGQVDVQYWLKHCRNLRHIVLDRDYVFDDVAQVGVVAAQHTISQLLPQVTVTVAGGECTYNLFTFAAFCGLV